MPISNEMRRLEAKWKSNAGWPKRLESLEIRGVRGWNGERLDCKFPIMAIVGENGVGKSTVLQAAASVYNPPDRGLNKGRYASDFFPDTVWELVKDAQIGFAYREGQQIKTGTLRKPGERWRGNPSRPLRHVEYIDLSRIQPVPARVGYQKIVKSKSPEHSSSAFDGQRLARFSQVMGRVYEFAKMSLTQGDPNRQVPVLKQRGAEYSGFHQGAGETTVAELLQVDLPQTAIVLIDEIETSLHPKAQRRLMQDLARLCRERELQIILSTHSPYILDELPFEARAYIMPTATGRTIIPGVSAEFAMSRMDDVPHHECDIYVEDERAKVMLTEILAAQSAGQTMPLIERCQIIPYGAASVGQALGQMKASGRFSRATCVFLDGDQSETRGCLLLPGEDAPERVVFNALRSATWSGIAERTGRNYSDVVDNCTAAMTMTDHHLWPRQAASKLVLGTNVLWQAMTAQWVATCLPAEEARRIAQVVEDAINGVEPTPTQAPEALPPVPPPIVAERTRSAPTNPGQESLF